MIAKPAAIPPICGAKTDSTPAPSVTISSGHSRLAIVRAGARSGSVCWCLALASRFAMACVASLREPMTEPMTVARIHQPKQT